jgi:predicted LPLAT superfamily acyltransferase
MKPRHWSTVTEAGAISGIRFMFAIYRWLGRLPFRIVLYPVILYYFLFRGAARRASLEYLRHVRADNRLTSQQPLLLQSYRHFMNFGESILDKLAVWQGDISLDSLAFHNHEVFDDLMHQGRGCIMVGSHLGNLEICRALAKRNVNVTVNVLMHTAHATRFNEMLARANSEAHLNVIQVSEISPATAILLQQKIDAGELLVIAGDRTPVSGQGNVSEVSFLGERCDMPQGPFVLASILRCPVLTIFCLRRERGGKPFFDLYVDHFADRIRLPRRDRQKALQETTQRWADLLADYCQKAPLQWFNFYPYWHRSAADSTSKQSPKR